MKKPSHRGPLIAVSLLSLIGLSGCASQCCGQRSAPAAFDASPCCQTAAGERPKPAPQTTRILAVGHGSVNAFAGNSIGQQRLMAMRAAKLDAFRSLAEQVYGLRVWGQTSVNAFTAQNDSIKSYVDAFVRGARVVSLTPVADGNYEATVELELPADFIPTVSGQSAPPTARTAGAGCFGLGCAQPSVYSFSE